jgi:hypothetical protein
VNFDDALTAYRSDLVAAAYRWHAVTDRRRRRLLFATSAFALAAVIVGTAVAATGWLVGSPAPPSVKTDFGTYTPQLGFHPQPGNAVLVAKEGGDRLYATTNEEGSYCVILSTPLVRPPESMGGGTCISKATADQPIVAGLFPANRDRLLLAGRISVTGARSVEVQLPSGATQAAPLQSSGFFLLPITAKPCGAGTWSAQLQALTGDGKVVAAKTMLLEKDVGVGCILPGLHSSSADTPQYTRK